MGSHKTTFVFTVFLRDSDGNPLPPYTEFGFIGDIITGSGAIAPQDGMLRLDDYGSAMFMLKHSQMVIIQDVPIDIYIQIIERPDMNHVVSFRDSENKGVEVDSNDTSSLPMTSYRIFDFTNARVDIVPTGINLVDAISILKLFVLVAFSASIIFTVGIIYRRLKVAKR